MDLLHGSPQYMLYPKVKMIGLVVEIRKANEAIIRERHPIPTVEDVLQELNRNAYFSELNFRSEYYQIELEENSRNITTFVKDYLDINDYFSE